MAVMLINTISPNNVATALSDKKSNLKLPIASDRETDDIKSAMRSLANLGRSSSLARAVASATKKTARQADAAIAFVKKTVKSTRVTASLIAAPSDLSPPDDNSDFYLFPTAVRITLVHFLSKGGDHRDFNSVLELTSRLFAAEGKRTSESKSHTAQSQILFFGSFRCRSDLAEFIEKVEGLCRKFPDY